MTGGGASAEGRPPVYKAVGVSLAVASGVFIGVSFVLKKKGLLAANEKDGKEAGKGYGYLKNVWWWSGMILMILGEICNFCAYAFVEAILVTPLGALSVVITAILSSIFLKERLSFVGKIGCFMCIIGSVVIVINAPSQTSVRTIQDMQRFIISPGFLTYAGIVILSCIGIVIWVAPKYGNKSMMVYLTVCSLIGGLSVVATQGLGAAVVTQIGGEAQFNQWFLYVLLVFVVVTLLVEIIYLNKALNIFNAALVTPTYYVIFTSATIVTSAILFRGFKGSPSSITTVVMGFLQICSGVVLLQLSKSAKDVPDTEIFRGDLDQVRTVAEMSEPESEPKADAIRGTAAIIRRISVARRTAEAEEAKKIHEDRMRDLHTPASIGESIEWDGVRRRVTFSGAHGSLHPARRRNTLSGQHPPLGMARIPDLDEDVEPVSENGGRRRSMSVDEAMRQRAYPDLESQLQSLPEQEILQDEGFMGRVRGFFIPKQRSRVSLRDEAEVDTSPSMDLRDSRDTKPKAGRPRVHTHAGPPPPLTDYAPYSSAPASHSSPHITFDSPTEMKSYDFATQPPPLKRTISGGGSEYTALPNPTSSAGHISETSLSKSAAKPIGVLRPESRGSARRQFSFQNILHPRHGHERSKSSSTVGIDGATDGKTIPWKKHSTSGTKTEEEMLGLVKGDTTVSSSSSAPTEGSENAAVRIVSERSYTSTDDSESYIWREKE
ncbi:magnesium transporter NIPA-domain-containing protein [Geopyxis carbonaria]|nr:magnesium transporter NIPA-domain-containing protein [Geopyxis carbonaria]